MIKIFEYPLQVAAQQAVAMPQGAKILGVQLLGVIPILSVEADDEQKLGKKTIYAFQAGAKPDGASKPIGTIQVKNAIYYMYC